MVIFPVMTFDRSKYIAPPNPFGELVYAVFPVNAQSLISTENDSIGIMEIAPPKIPNPFEKLDDSMFVLVACRLTNPPLEYVSVVEGNAGTTVLLNVDVLNVKVYAITDNTGLL